MGMASFHQGASVELLGKRYVLLRKVDEKLWQLEEERTGRISEYTASQLHQLYVEAKLRFEVGRPPRADAKPGTGSRPVDLDPVYWEMAKMRRAYVMAVLEGPNTEDFIAPRVSALWEKLKAPERAPNWTTVYRWKRAYLAAAKDASALALELNKSGNKNKRYPPEVTTIVQSAIEDKYLKLERKTIQDTLDHVIALVQRENEMLPESIQLSMPTRRLVKRMIDEIPAYDRYVARYGATAARQRFRSVQGHRTTEGPLERAEIDHTPMDLMVIDDNACVPLGRPYLTCCIDDHSRCILGIYLGFEPPSHLTVAHCLKDAFLPKVGLKEKYPAIKNDWDAHGIMRELVVDNGSEFHSASLENACYTLGIEIHYAPRKVAWFKGKIERFFGTLNEGVAHGNPGTTFRNIFEKDDYDPSKHAVIRLSRLQEIIRLWIVDYYHQKPHRTIHIPPAVKWDTSICPEDIQVPDDPWRLDAILGKSVERRLSHKGIEYDSLFYNSPELAALRMSLGANLEVEIRVDDSDLGHIVVLSEDKTRMFKAKALSFEYANGLNRWTHRVCKNFAAREWRKEGPASWLEAKLRISEIIDEEFLHKRMKTRKRIARFRGDASTADTPAREHPRAPESVTAQPLAPAMALVESASKTVPAPPPAPEAVPTSATTAPDVATGPRKKFTPQFRDRSTSIYARD